MWALQAASLDILLEVNKTIVDALPGLGKVLEVLKGKGKVVGYLQMCPLGFRQ